MPLLDYSYEHPLVKELMNWLGKVFVDLELLNYFKKIIASFLVGRNAEKMFQVWTGGSNGSKSIIVKFIHLILGQYSIDVPEEVFTTKPMGRSGPSPELAQFEGAHTGFISETDADIPFKMGAVKKWTGGDRFFARMCNDDGGSINAVLKMILVCNEPPKIKNADKAVHNRWLHLPFLSEFVYNPPDTIEEQYNQRKFKMDPFFEKRLPDLALAGAWLMFDSFKEYIKGLSPPKIAVDHTNQYWEDNDPVLIFIQEHLENVTDDNGQFNTNYSVTASELYPVFITWFKQFYQGEQAMSSPTFKTNLCMLNHLGPHTNNRWYGVRMRKAQHT